MPGRSSLKELSGGSACVVLWVGESECVSKDVGDRKAQSVVHSFGT